MSVLEFSDVRQAYQHGVDVLAGVDVLHGVSFAVEPGQVVGLLGGNGASKTTLLRIALGLIAPHQGSVRVLGLDPRAIRSRSSGASATSPRIRFCSRF